jgi:hypothetical protein
MLLERLRLAAHGLLALVVVAGCGDSAAPATSRPGAPSNLVAGPLGGGVHLTWQDNSSDEELFEIERKEEGNNAFWPLDNVPFSTVLYHDANVSVGKAYTYRVRAKLPTSFSGYSNQATVTLQADGSAVAATGGTSNAAAGSSGMLGGSGNPSGGAGGVGSAGEPSRTVASFRTDVVPSLVQSCGSTTAGCHNSDQAVGRIMPQFGPCKVIWYAATDEPVGATYTSGPNQGQPTGCPDLDLYERLMGLHSMLCDAPTWEQRAQYVVPFDLDKSLLYQVIAGDPSMGGVCKNMAEPVRKMPLVDPMILPNGVALGPERIAKIRDWILQGAPNN